MPSSLLSSPSLLSSFVCVHMHILLLLSAGITDIIATNYSLHGFLRLNSHQ